MQKHVQNTRPGPVSSETTHYVPFFTGVYAGRHYWKGKEWTSPTNMVGCDPRVVYDPDTRRYFATTDRRSTPKTDLAPKDAYQTVTEVSP